MNGRAVVRTRTPGGVGGARRGSLGIARRPYPDCNIYVRSKAAGERVMASVTRFLEEKLRLKVNAAKSAVARPWERTFLGYSMTMHMQPRLKVARQSIVRLKHKLKGHFRRGRGQSVLRLIEELTPVLRGWMTYFRLAEAKGIFDELDSWIRRKLPSVPIMMGHFPTHSLR